MLVRKVRRVNDEICMYECMYACMYIYTISRLSHQDHVCMYECMYSVSE